MHMCTYTKRELMFKEIQNDLVVLQFAGYGIAVGWPLIWMRHTQVMLL